MSRSVYEVEDVCFTVLCLVLHLYGVALDGYAALAFQIHVVEHLPFGYLDGLCLLQQAVGKCALAVVNMCYDAKISYLAYILHL